MFFSTFVSCEVVCLVCSTVHLLAVGNVVLQYSCGWRGSVPGMFCSTVVDGVVVYLVYSAVQLLVV
jgi:hypothetical protein